MPLIFLQSPRIGLSSAWCGTLLTEQVADQIQDPCAGVFILCSAGALYRLEMSVWLEYISVVDILTMTAYRERNQK